MKRYILPVTSVLAAFSLTSCLQHETTIHLNKDGSGTVVDETTFGAQMMGMLEQMSSMGGAAAKDPIAGMFSEEKAKAHAAKMGEGVTLEKNEVVTKNGNKGGRATYHFADINKLRVSTSEGLKDINPMGDLAPAPAAADPSKPIIFIYADGKLTVAMPASEKPDAPAGEKPAADQPEADEQQTAMMKQMMSDMKMSFKLVVEPGIAETTATHRTDKTITLMEMEMGKLLENPETMKKLQSMDKEDPSAAIEAIKSIPGVKIEAQKEFTVKVN